MGSEAKCTVRADQRKATGTARLESEELQFRSPDLKLTIPFKTIETLAVRDGALRVTSATVSAVFELGAAAEKWLEKIKNPPSRLKKLGIKAGMRVSIVQLDDPAFAAELHEAGANVSTGRAAKDSDAIFFGATKTSQLDRVATLKRSLVQNGALWVIYPKGRPDITQAAVMAAGKAAGLVDVKVVSFSSVLTTEKLVIPLAKRR